MKCFFFKLKPEHDDDGCWELTVNADYEHRAVELLEQSKHKDKVVHTKPYFVCPINDVPEEVDYAHYGGH